jgi:hypothetical protein
MEIVTMTTEVAGPMKVIGRENLRDPPRVPKVRIIKVV